MDGGERIGVLIAIVLLIASFFIYLLFFLPGDALSSKQPLIESVKQEMRHDPMTRLFG
jgi:hypothetical protein